MIDVLLSSAEGFGVLLAMFGFWWYVSLASQGR